MRDGEEQCEDDAGEPQLETELGYASGELVALRTGFLPAQAGEGSGGRLREGGLELEASPVGLTLERLFV